MLGCSSGAFSRALAKREHLVLALDIMHNFRKIFNNSRLISASDNRQRRLYECQPLLQHSKLADLLNCKSVLDFAFRLNSRVENGSLGTPYKLPISIWLTLMFHKLYGGSLTRASFPKILHTLGNPHGRCLILSKLTRAVILSKFI